MATNTSPRPSNSPPPPTLPAAKLKKSGPRRKLSKKGKKRQLDRLTHARIRKAEFEAKKAQLHYERLAEAIEEQHRRQQEAASEPAVDDNFTPNATKCDTIRARGENTNFKDPTS